MELPQKLADALGTVDDDYLIGLCNKGTVNRAKKDLAALSAPELEINEDSVVVRWAEVECVIRTPLGESGCSCPSSSICRHRIAAILWLQENCRQNAQSEGPSCEENPGDTPRKFEELAAYPTDKLLRQLGVRQLSSVLFRLESGSLPKISKTSVVTVEMPWVPATVRLLEPLEHSTCTCRSKSFCLHKAQALLYWKTEEGLVDQDTLNRAIHTSEATACEKGKGVCQAVQEMLSAQMTTGLSRMPDTVCDTVERMASLCHTARLPSLERALRRLHREYTRYFDRSALYRDIKLLQLLAQAFRLAQQLEQAEDGAYQELAGEFRDEYINIGSLQLYLLTQKNFSGNSGYSGVICYFWSPSNHRFYTFHQLRPVQEEQRRWRPTEFVWNMPCTLLNAMHYTLDLSGAKVSHSGKLSATEQCKAVMRTQEDPWNVFPEEEIFTDFARLLYERSAPHLPESRRVALVYPRRCVPQEYDTVRQMFSMELVDEAGRVIYLESTYRQGGEETMEWLEQTAEKLRKTPKLRPMFFGAVYREEDKLKLFPIEIMTDWGDRDE